MMKCGTTGLAILGLMMAQFPGMAISTQEYTQERSPGNLPPSYLAQRNIIGECRAVAQETWVYNEGNADANKIGSLQPETRVTLAGNLRNGWIAIDKPILGFIAASRLKLCSEEKITLCTTNAAWIYGSRSPQQDPIRSLLPDEEVTLSPERVGGWRTVLEPVPGFIQQAQLKPCDPSTEGSPEASNRRPTSRATESSRLCHRVTSLVDSGLNVRTQPTEEAEVIRSMVPGTVVRLKSPNAQVGSDGRSWVQIVSPVTGWVSDGRTGNRVNLSSVPCGGIG